MITIDEVEVMLDEIAGEFPEVFFRDLNGGILLLPDAKYHPEGRADDLYIMGEYHNNRNMGRYIIIYYGSFERVYGHLPAEILRDKLKKVLTHEFTHHMEHLAGERGLERKDTRNIERYKRNQFN